MYITQETASSDEQLAADPVPNGCVTVENRVDDIGRAGINIGPAVDRVEIPIV